MQFKPLDLAGVSLLEPERFADERGFFARTYCRDELLEHGLDPTLSQCSVSFNPYRGTLRGMHYQAAPHGEAKLIRCTRGAILDVLVDLRPDSETFRSWVAERLDQDNRHLLFVPPGIAHGFLTLEPDSEVFYQISTPYHPASARGVRWNDPAFGIDWPQAPAMISERDNNYPDFTG